MPYKDPEEHGVSEQYGLEPEQAAQSRQETKDLYQHEKEKQKAAALAAREPSRMTRYLPPALQVAALLLHTLAAWRAYAWLNDDEQLECCGQVIADVDDYFDKTSLIPLVYLGLIALDALLLIISALSCAASCRLPNLCGCCCGSKKGDDDDDDFNDRQKNHEVYSTDNLQELDGKTQEDKNNVNSYEKGEHDDKLSKDAPTGLSGFGRLLLWLVCLNSWMGSLAMMAITYRGKDNVLWLWTLEMAALLCWTMVLCAWRTRVLQWSNPCTFLLRLLLAWLPILLMAFTVWLLKEKGGFCYRMDDDDAFQIGANGNVDAGCELCMDGFPPDADGNCYNNDRLERHQTFCGGDNHTSFCFYSFE